jgi:diaminopimelate epimerase
VENQGNDRFRVKMGKPDFSTNTLKMKTELPVFHKQKLHDTEVTAVYTGTIHAVVYVSELESVLSGNLGALISSDPIFFDRANVNFVQVLDDKNFRVRTYERGVGWTFACGTGATAAYAVGKLDGICHDSVSIHFPYGTLLIEEIEDILYLSGEACHIASGILHNVRVLKK